MRPTHLRATRFDDTDRTVLIQDSCHATLYRPRSLTLFATAMALALASMCAQASSTGVVISQVYGGGGNSGATYKNDFVELFNAGNAAVSLAGWSVQYASATGTTWQVTNLTNAVLQPGQYYLVQQAAGTGGTTALPTPDATGTIAMSGTAGQGGLVRATTALSGAGINTASVEDFVGFGTTASAYEGSGATPAPSNTLVAARGPVVAPTPTTTPAISARRRPPHATPPRPWAPARQPQ